MPIEILGAMTAKPPRIDYVLPGLVAGTVGALVSPGGSGKSAFALQVCAQVAGGRDILGLGEVPTGRAVYLPAEDPESVLIHRLFALGELYSQKEREAISDRLMIEPLLAHKPDVLDRGWFEAIKRFADGSRLICIDTLRMFHSAEENDSGQMSEVVGRLKNICADTQATLIFLHHTTKSAALHRQGAEQQASRGSSVLVDNVRWQGYLVTMAPEEAKAHEVEEEQRHYFVRFGISKQNYGKPFRPKWYKKTPCRDKDIEGGFTLQPAHLGKPKLRTIKGGRSGEGRF
ncbi:MAG: helicase RepA family protein [Trichloromonadaceae bacterium]